MPKGKKQKQDKRADIFFEISGILFLGFFILSYFSFFSAPSTLSYSLSLAYRNLFGVLSLFVPLIFGIIGFYLISLKDKFFDSLSLFIFNLKFAGYLLYIISLFGLLSQIKTNAAGLIGNEISNFLSSLFDIPGSYIILSTIMLISFPMIFSTSLSAVIDFILKNNNIKDKINVLFAKIKNVSPAPASKDLPPEVIFSPQQTVFEIAPQPPDASHDRSPSPKDEEKEEINQEEKTDKIISPARWELPDLSLFKYCKDASYGSDKIPLDQSEEIIKTLNEFNVEVEVVNVEIGPVVTRYELRPAEGVKVKEITSLSNDVALRLAASPIRIEAPIPGKAAIGIEVPNKIKDIVPLKEVLEKFPTDSNFSKNLIFALGKDISGTYKIADLTRMPHLLIAGATGSGKSICLNALISSFLFRLTPEDIRFLLIDPKRVELSSYKGIPHLATKVITDVKQAAGALSRAIEVMDGRYGDFAEAGVRNIEVFNKKYPENKKFYFVIIIDELADLMLQVGQEIEKSICRLAQLGRATGIHLVIATQRPSVNVITGLIKANIPSRIAFAVVSQMESRIILDYGGAENLLGSGDMLFLPIDAPKSTRMQGTFISEDDTKRLVDFWRKQGAPQYLEEFQDLPQDTGIETQEDEANRDIPDEFFKEAVKIILENNQASVSILQRKLKIGYARAGRLVDIMERRGIVGPFAGSKQRELLVGWDYLEKL